MSYMCIYIAYLFKKIDFPGGQIPGLYLLNLVYKDKIQTYSIYQWLIGAYIFLNILIWKFLNNNIKRIL